MSWTLAQAKDQLSEVVRRAASQGPQTISVRGRDAAVLIDKAAYDRLIGSDRPTDFKAFLLAIPSLEGVDLTRNPSPGRVVDL